jgi:hypothetical protein
MMDVYICKYIFFQNLSELQTRTQRYEKLIPFCCRKTRSDLSFSLSKLSETLVHLYEVQPKCGERQYRTENEQTDLEATDRVGKN